MPLGQKNPLTMVGTLAWCWLFTFRTPADDARALLPPGLEPVTHRGCGFWNVVLCRVDQMRPWPAPPFLGTSYWQVSYRLYVRVRPKGQEPIEGLYFLRSDCDSALLQRAGNLLTDFNFQPARIQVQETPETAEAQVYSAETPARWRLSRATPVTLASDSPFDSVDEAAAFLKYKPRSISMDPSGRANVVQIVRDEERWRSRLVHVEAQSWSYLAGHNVQPEICYEVEPLAYRWNRGQLVDVEASA
jgi:uncharacterized protein YqjF (DUF2071 family)